MFPWPPHWASSLAPGFIERNSAENIASWSLTQWKVAFEKATSTGSGSDSSTRSWHRIVAFGSPPSASAACAAIEGETSTP